MINNLIKQADFYFVFKNDTNDSLLCLIQKAMQAKTLLPLPGWIGRAKPL